MIIIKKIFTLTFLLILVLIAGCKEKEVTAPIAAEPETIVTEEIKVTEPEKLTCSSNSDCNGELCINNKCGKLEDYYASDCAEICKIAGVFLTTSDGEEYIISSGEGSYSYAGALEWKLVNTPAYCKGNDPLIPLRLIKKNTGQVLGEEYITLKKGEVSKVITHPNITRVEFTVTIDDVTEECG